MLLQFRKSSQIIFSVWRRMLGTSIAENEVEFKKINRVGQIILNRPKQLNALNLNMVKLMRHQMTEFEKDSEVDAIVIKGAGETAFCAGGDVKTIREHFLKGDNPSALEFFREEYKLNNQIANCSKPYIALINGITMGGGVGVSVHGRYRIATEKTLFAMPETAIGFFADVGGSYFLPRLKDHLGLFLALTGNRLKGQELKSTGIATHYLKSSNIPSLEKILYEAPYLNASAISEIISMFDEKLTDEYDTSKISKCFNESSLENIIANLEKDGSEWSKQQLKLLSKMSPTSLKVTIRQLREGSIRTLQGCLEMEYLLVQKFATKNDFKEGVRAVLIDRGSKPNWEPATYQQVDEKFVDWFFDFGIQEKLDKLYSSKL